MLLTRVGRLVLPAGLVFVAAGQMLFAVGLHLRAVEGQGIVVAPGAISSRRIVVRVENDRGQSLPGAIVRFRLPAEGSSGRFASGLTSETAISGPDGQAMVYGIAWNSQPGPLMIAVSCTLGEDTAQTEIPVEISQRPEKEVRSTNPGHYPASGSGKKWLTFAAVIGGGAALAAGMAFAHKSNTLPAPYTPAPINITTAAPVVGIPSITVGPQH